MKFSRIRNQTAIVALVACLLAAGGVSAHSGSFGGDDVEICVRTPGHPDGRTFEVSRFYAFLLKRFFPKRITFGACDDNSCTRNRDCTQPESPCEEAICVRGECQIDDALECPTLDPCTVGMCVDDNGVAECQFVPKVCDQGEECNPRFGVCIGPGPLERTKIATLAYIYGLAPVIVAKTQFDQTNSTKDEVTYAPFNELYINTQVATPDNQLFVSPNPNVVYSSTHMDLSKGPMALFTPSSGDRYYVWQVMDAYTNNFEYIGTRNTNGAVANYVFVGPDFKGRVPRGFTRIDCPQNNMWMVGRFEADSSDPRDVRQAIRLIQRNVFLPLQEFQNRPPGFKNPIIRKPRRTVPDLNIDGLNFFTVLNEWLTANPPPAEDDDILEQLAEIGVGPGFTTDFDALRPRVQQQLLEGMMIGLDLVQAEAFLATSNFGGYRAIIGPELGTYGTQYLLRSAAARGGLGVNSNVEALYPLALTTAAFLPLRGGENTYQSRFTADMLPVPVNAFWSITAYDRSTGRLIANSIDRYTVGNQDDLFVDPSDGSITVYMQSTDPGGDKTANWLPTMTDQDGKFYLILRAYFPDPVMYTPPPPDGPDYIVPALRRTFLGDE